jgi:hypothetical protein
LAKYYEHHAKDLNAARHWTLAAIQVLENHHLPAYEYHQWKESFEHRFQRLEQKLSKLSD